MLQLVQPTSQVVHLELGKCYDHIHLLTIFYDNSNPDHSQTNLTSLEGLAKYIDPSQLTADLEGSLAYDHTIWIEMRCVSAIL